MLTVKQIVEAYQAPVQWDVDPNKHYNWDGEHINVFEMEEEQILHELGHWLIAPETSKWAKDYGLGGGPDSPTSNFVYGMYKDTGQEETLACIMEFFLGVLCGKNMKAYLSDRFFIDSNDGHWVGGTNYKDFLESIKELQKRNCLDEYWVPVQLKKIIGSAELDNLGKFKELLASIKED
jgi:hypothetical protein